MMQNRQWIGAMRKKFLDIRSSRDKEKLEAMIEEYETACDLSRGANAARAAHWTQRCKEIVRRLGKFTAMPIAEFTPGK